MEQLSERTYRYVRLPDAGSFLSLGWVDTHDFEGCHHGYWSTLMYWPKGEPKYPEAS